MLRQQIAGRGIHLQLLAYNLEIHYLLSVEGAQRKRITVGTEQDRVVLADSARHVFHVLLRWCSKKRQEMLLFLCKQLGWLAFGGFMNPAVTGALQPFLKRLVPKTQSHV